MTKVTLDMLACAQALFVQEPKVQGEDVVVLMEMTMKNLTTEAASITRISGTVDILAALGKTVLISNLANIIGSQPIFSATRRR